MIIKAILAVFFFSALIAACQKLPAGPTPTPTAIATATSTATPTPTATPVPPTPTPVPVPDKFIATRYGESYNGSPMGCVGSGTYSSNNVGILAAPPALYGDWPCGTKLQVCYQGTCIQVTRTDSCPGCGANHVDLSEAGTGTLCGQWPANTCDYLDGVTITVLSKPAGIALEAATEAEIRLVDRCGYLERVTRENRKVCIDQVVR